MTLPPGPTTGAPSALSLLSAAAARSGAVLRRWRCGSATGVDAAGRRAAVRAARWPGLAAAVVGAAATMAPNVSARPNAVRRFIAIP